MQEIPVLNFSKIFQNDGSESESAENWAELAKEVRRACHEIGFMYILNHGIPSDKIEAVFSESRRFFALPKSRKQDFLIDAKNKYRGYTCPGQEILSPEVSYEFREAFAIVGMESEQPFPDEELPEFKTSLFELQRACNPFVKALLKLFAKALLLEDEDYFVQGCKGLDDLKINNRSTLRTHFYPAIPSNIEIPAKAVRCGTHSDYAVCTLLFQDSLGGLEVMNAKEEWIPADPIPNSVLVNLGDLMEIWTNGYFKATKHRVLIPEAEIIKRTPRQSIANFIASDDYFPVSKLKSSVIPNNIETDYEPINYVEYLENKLGSTYQY